MHFDTFCFPFQILTFNPSGLKSITKESEEPSDSNKVDFNPPGLTGAEISALKVGK